MSWLGYLLCLVFLADALRLRAKFRALPVLLQRGGKPPTDYTFLAAPGVAAGEHTITAAADYARSSNLELLDVVPCDAPALELMRMFHRIDVRRYGTDRISPGHTTGYGLLVSRKLLARCGAKPEEAASASMYRLAVLFKKYARDKAGIALATGWQAAAGGNGTQSWPLLYEFMGADAKTFLLLRSFVLLALLVSVLLSTRAGLIAIAAFHAQVLLIFAGQQIRPRNLIQTVLFRTALDFWDVCRHTASLLAGQHPDAAEAKELRSRYASELTGGIERFFEKRSDDCPLCGGHQLNAWIRTTDLFQAKPGRFTLDRCSDCGHVFQNPRLSRAGLEFYYRDFYDGLGTADTERIFQAGPVSYFWRADAIRRLARPARWLDVGAAYGHFCCYARSIFPDTEFDGLDMGGSIEEAARTGWVSRGFRGHFPEIAPRLSGQYDVVSFFHCLEHVLEPADEIRAAHTVLAPGGLMIIEVPNPECWFGRIFRRFWWFWAQPQHLHLLSVRNLSALLRQHGFEPIVLEGTYVEPQSDIFLSTVLFLQWLGPKTGMPWQPRATVLSRFRRVTWALGFPILLLAAFADVAFGPFARRLKIASAYRLVARRVEISDPAAAACLRAESRELQFQ